MRRPLVVMSSLTNVNWLTYDDLSSLLIRYISTKFLVRLVCVVRDFFLSVVFVPCHHPRLTGPRFLGQQDTEKNGDVQCRHRYFRTHLFFKSFSFVFQPSTSSPPQSIPYPGNATNRSNCHQCHTYSLFTIMSHCCYYWCRHYRTSFALATPLHTLPLTFYGSFKKPRT